MYNEGFYEMYRKYLLENIVRRNHNRMFETFYRFVTPTSLNIVDLGCGLGEYLKWGTYNRYVGVDLNNPGNLGKFIQADYHDFSFVKLLPFSPNAFVSLFSIECCHDFNDKYVLYEKLFEKIPSLKFGLVSGFFYKNKRYLKVVEESGGIISFQSVESPLSYISENFSEVLVSLETPSKMFGDDVVEVWKIFVKK